MRFPATPWGHPCFLLIILYFYGNGVKSAMYMKESSFDEKEYSPQSSQKLAEWSPGGFRDEAETLYRTGKGNFFILAQFGMISRQRRPRGEGSWYGGTEIRPVTAEEALAWCQETGNYEIVDQYFPWYA
jgi:hypothetical protein